MPRGKYIRTSKKAKECSFQYMNSILKSLNRVESADFNWHTAKLKDKKLIRLLLAICFDEKKLLTDIVETLKNTSYRQYFEEDLAVKIEHHSVKRFYQPKTMALPEERGFRWQRKGQS